MVAGWCHVVQWLRDARLRGLEQPIADMEWSAVTVLLLACFLALGHNSETSLRTLGAEPVTTATAKNKWELVQLRESPNSSALPPWLRSKAWQSLVSVASGNPDTWPSNNFITFHIRLAKRWIASLGGLAAFGFEGYLPTALNRIGHPREAAASSLLLALHLLVEEQKLNILSPEDVSPGLSDLKAILCQLFRWVGWMRYEATYALGGQADPINSPSLGKWIQV
jgi:anaphase-promoting complex subunit 1